MKPNHTDERGTITDMLVTPDYSITHITFNPGAVRGNHYHEHTTQFDFLLKGSLICAEDWLGVRREKKLTEKTALIHPPMQAHAYKSLEYSEMISICFGVRKGADYEKDVIRLETPLL